MKVIKFMVATDDPAIIEELKDAIVSKLKELEVEARWDDGESNEAPTEC
jgi:hypothetical protein